MLFTLVQDPPIGREIPRTGEVMRLHIAVPAALVLLALAAPAQAGKYFKDCRRMTRQIDRYEGVVEMAEDRDNELWAEATKRHIERLMERRAELCPQFAEEVNMKKRAVKAAEDTQKLMKAAAKIAARYFSGGWY